jgi:hypothetical protein
MAAFSRNTLSSGRQTRIRSFGTFSMTGPVVFNADVRTENASARCRVEMNIVASRVKKGWND